MGHSLLRCWGRVSPPKAQHKTKPPRNWSAKKTTPNANQKKWDKTKNYLCALPTVRTIYGQMLTIFQREETYVAAMGGALYETKRTGDARQSQN